jgi:hypothetical protein
MNLHDRINRVINTDAFEQSLTRSGIELFEFQSNWSESGKNGFSGLPKPYRDAIVAGEKELSESGAFELA